MPKIVDHDQYRKEMLSKCFDLFAEKGYSAITMRQIAEGLNVSTGTLYHYFPSKQVLFEQLVEAICERDILMAAAELEGIETLQERVEALGRLIVKNEDYATKWTYIWVDFCQHQDQDEIQKSEVYKKADERYRLAIRDFLGIQDPALASFVLCLLDGLILERSWSHERISIPEQFTLLGKMLTAYLEKEAKTSNNSLAKEKL